MSVNLEFDVQDPRRSFIESEFNRETIHRVGQVENTETALELIYPNKYITDLSSNLLSEVDYFDKSNGRGWGVFVLKGTDRYADIAKYIENKCFSNFFNHHPLEHYVDYGVYDENSYFVTVINTDNDEPIPASVLRVVNNDGAGLKTINTLACPSEEQNPWYPELSDALGRFSYLDQERVRQNLEHMFNINPDTTWAIETMAVAKEYAGKHGEFGAASFPLYVACLQLANRLGVESWISIQDLKPLMQMQRLFASPWDVNLLSVRNYEGNYPAVPAVIPDLNEAQRKLRSEDSEMAALLIDGAGVSLEYVMPDELQGEDTLDLLKSDYKADHM